MPTRFLIRIGRDRATSSINQPPIEEPTRVMDPEVSRSIRNSTSSRQPVRLWVSNAPPLAPHPA